MAGFVDNYPHLPGHLTEFKDGGLQLVKETNAPETDSILLIGTGVDGPIMQPVKVDPQTYELFGKCVDDNSVPNGATLPKAFEEAYAGGCRDIRMMRITGSVAKFILEGSASKKEEDAVFEGILGAATGNVAKNSAFYLQDTAINLVDVQANGVTLTTDQYEFVASEVVPDKFLDKNNTICETEDCIEVKIIKGTDTIVELASDDIYENDTTKEKVWGASLSGSTTGHTILIHKDVDYVKKGETDASLAFVDSKETIVAAKSKDGALVKPLERAKVTIKEGVTDSGSFVVVKYEDSKHNFPVENASDVSGTYKANGIPQEFVLKNKEGDFIIPLKGMTKLYFDGVEYTELDTIADSNEKVFEVVKFTEDKIDKAKIVLQPGKHGKRGAKIDTRLLYKLTTEYTPKLTIETTFGGRIYNESKVSVESVVHEGNFVEKIVKIYKPKSKRSQANEEPLTYSSIDYPTFALLARAINNDGKNANLFKAYVNRTIELTPTHILNAIPVAKNFSGGEDGINVSRQDLFEKLSGKRDANGSLTEAGAYQLLENYTVDMVIPCGVCADDVLVGKYDNFAYELALFCAVVSHRNHATIGLIQTSSPDDASLLSIENHVRKLENYNNLYFMRDSKGNIILDSEQKPIDLGKNICVLAGGDGIFQNTRLGVYADNSAAAIAGFISTLPANSAATNKVLKFLRGLKIKYSNSQLERLTANRLITLKYKNNGENVAVVDAMTCARPGSDYERLSSVRAVREIANDIREVSDPFLGEANTVEQRNSLSSLIDKRLGLHKEAGTIKDYSFQIIASSLDELIGQATIELTLVPAQELRRITTIISLKPTI